MTVASLKELEALVRMCRKQGVSSVEVDGIKLVMGDEPERATKANSEISKDATDESMYDEEQLLMWSAAGVVNG
jgi:hypothetical protein